MGDAFSPLYPLLSKVIQFIQFHARSISRISALHLDQSQVQIKDFARKGILNKCLYGEAPLRGEVQSLTLLCTRHPFHIPSIDKWHPFHIPCLELYILLTAVNALSFK